MTANRFRFRMWLREEREMVYSTDREGMGLMRLTYLEHDDDCPPRVIMQSTGLVDKNGREIFESDVLKVPSGVFVVDHWLHVVKWKELESIEPSEQMVGFDLPERWKESEVIGNVYEHPELLTEPSAPSA